MSKMIIIYSCSECPYFKLHMDRFFESSMQCQKLKKCVNKDFIDPDCPLNDINYLIN